MLDYLALLFLLASVFGGSLFALGSLIFILCLLSLTYYAGVWLDETELRAGSRIHLYRIGRNDVRGARCGGVSHFRGWKVPGIELVLDHGKTTGLPMSALLGARRRDEWIDTINEWAGAEESLRRGYRPSDAWSLDRFLDASIDSDGGSD